MLVCLLASCNALFINFTYTRWFVFCVTHKLQMHVSLVNVADNTNRLALFNVPCFAKFWYARKIFHCMINFNITAHIWSYLPCQIMSYRILLKLRENRYVSKSNSILHWLLLQSTNLDSRKKEHDNYLLDSFLDFLTIVSNCIQYFQINIFQKSISPSKFYYHCHIHCD